MPRGWHHPGRAGDTAVVYYPLVLTSQSSQTGGSLKPSTWCSAPPHPTPAELQLGDDRVRAALFTDVSSVLRTLPGRGALQKHSFKKRQGFLWVLMIGRGDFLKPTPRAVWGDQAHTWLPGRQRGAKMGEGVINPQQQSTSGQASWDTSWRRMSPHVWPPPTSVAASLHRPS